MSFKRVKDWLRSVLEFFVFPFEFLGFSPNLVTLTSLLLALLAVFLFFRFNQVLGLSVFVLAVLVDALDGALARRTGRVSDFGGYLDSVVDKCVEGLLFFCFLVYDAPLAFLAGLSSVLVSYSRHRADEFGVRVNVGWFERAERLGFILVSGLFLEIFGLQSLISYVLTISTLLSVLTIVQRVLEAKNKL